MEIKHLSHKHRLTLYDHKRKEYDRENCKGCQMRISSDDFYICKRCNYYICKSCAELPPEMSHPFHREHPLTLLAESPYESGDPCCEACSKICNGLFFNCYECQFDLDVNCATLVPTTKEEEEEQHMTHPHPLIRCDRKNKELDFECVVCQLPIKKGTIYFCSECRAIFDKWCSQLPQQITHHFHPHHSLTLKRYFNPVFNVDSRCNACSDMGGFRYSCSKCAKFSLDVRCASLIPTTTTKEEEEQQQMTHPHALIPCDTNNTNANFSFPCSACNISIEGTVYVCLQCQFSLHKSCAELPSKIKHPFHPHPLLRRDTRDIYECDACKSLFKGFMYRCAQKRCYFSMDIRCASLRSTVKFKLHHHPLAFFNKQNKEINYSTYPRNRIQCSVGAAACSGHDLSLPYFRCVPCNFNLDLFCVPTLPHTFKHSNHGHSLTLTFSPIKDNSDDDNDSEYYCDLCEERRQLKEPTYYCEECHYVAQVSCVFQEILPLLEKEWSDEEIVMHQAEVDALIAKLETLTTKLDKINQKPGQHIGDYQIGVTEVETKNALKDQKTILSAASDHPPAIAKPNEEIVLLQAEVDVLTTKLETLTTKLDELKERHPHHDSGYQIEGIPSLGIKLSVTVLDNSDEVVEEDSNVKRSKSAARMRF